MKLVVLELGPRRGKTAIVMTPEHEANPPTKVWILKIGAPSEIGIALDRPVGPFSCK